MNNSTLVNMNTPADQVDAVWKRVLRDAGWLYALTPEDIQAFLSDEEPEEVAPEPEPEEVTANVAVPGVSQEKIAELKQAIIKAAALTGIDPAEKMDTLFNHVIFEDLTEGQMMRLLAEVEGRKKSWGT